MTDNIIRKKIKAVFKKPIFRKAISLALALALIIGMSPADTYVKASSDNNDKEGVINFYEEDGTTPIENNTIELYVGESKTFCIKITGLDTDQSKNYILNWFNGSTDAIKLENVSVSDDRTAMKFKITALVEKRCAINWDLTYGGSQLASKNLKVTIRINEATRWNTEETEGGLRITDYTGSDTEVTVPDEIGGKPVISIKNISKADITKLIIPKTVKQIYGTAFSKMTALREVRFSELSSGIVSVGSSAFPANVEKIVFPEGMNDNDLRKIVPLTYLPREKLYSGSIPLPHDFSAYRTNAEEHYIVCSVDETEKPGSREPHKYEGEYFTDIPFVPADRYDTYHYQKCKCGVAFGDLHKWDSGREITKPSPEAPGVWLFTCTLCKWELNVEVPYTHTHDWNDWVIDPEPSESYEGKATRVCKSDSSHVETVDLPVLTNESVWTKGEYVPPTCAEEGSQVYESDYGTVVVVLRRLSHEYYDDFRNNADKHWQECKNCSHKNAEADHIWDDGNISQQPTVDSVGIMLYRCTVCGREKTEEIPKLEPDTSVSSDKSEPPTSSDEPEPPTVSDEPEPPTVSDEPEPPTVSDEPEPPTVSDEPEPPTVSDEPEPPTVSDEPEPPTVSDEPEPPTVSDEPEPPTVSDEPEPPTVSDEPEPPTVSDEPEPPIGSDYSGFIAPGTTAAASTESVTTVPAAAETTAPPSVTEGSGENPISSEDTVTSDMTVSDSAVITDVIYLDNISKNEEIKDGAPKALLSESASELAVKVFTIDELNMISEGTKAEIALVVEKTDGFVSDGDKKAVQSAVDTLSEYTLGEYMDISLFKILNGSRQQITEAKAPITVVIEISEELRALGREYKIIRVHDGEAAVLEDMDGDPDTVTVKTDLFSVYAIAYRDKSADGAMNTGVENHTLFFAVIGIATVFLLVFIYFTTGRKGISEATKNRMSKELIEWGKRGGKLRRYAALALVTFVLVHYYGIGMKSDDIR